MARGYEGSDKNIAEEVVAVDELPTVKTLSR
jgi:hypothetical protein